MSNLAPQQALVKQIFNIKKIWRCIYLACIPALLFYAISLIALKNAGFEPREILKEPAQISGASSLIGFLSNIGTWLWVSSVAICFFGVSISDRTAKNKHTELLFLVGMLSLTLAVDDFFMIHDRYVDQKICYSIYALWAGALLLRHFKKIIEIDGFAFLLAGFLLAASIMTDLFQAYIPIHYAFTQVFEEGFKFVGGATWLYFSWRMAAFPFKGQGDKQA
ncbi:MAG: hypothetical protein ACI84O_001632 [Myxococcota bacterium]|jgi:hypothetical protein